MEDFAFVVAAIVQDRKLYFTNKFFVRLALIY